MSEVMRRVRQERPSAAFNTVLLALADPTPSTGLRRYVHEVARQVISEFETAQAAQPVINPPIGVGGYVAAVDMLEPAFG